MKEFIINYRIRGNKNGKIYETSLTADNRKEAINAARMDLDEEYVIVRVRLA